MTKAATKRKANTPRRSNNVVSIKRGKAWSKEADALRAELHDFDKVGQENNRYGIVALILLERQKQFDWSDWAGQRMGSLSGVRKTEVQSYLEKGGFKRYSSTYIGKVWAAITKSAFCENAKDSFNNGGELIVDAKGLKTAIQCGAVQLDIKNNALNPRNPNPTNRTIPTDPKFIKNKAQYNKAMKHLNSKIAKLKKAFPNYS